MELEMMKESIFQALDAELGLAIEIGEYQIETVKARFYIARAKIDDPRVKQLSLFLPPGGRQVFIYKRPEADLD